MHISRLRPLNVMVSVSSRFDCNTFAEDVKELGFHAKEKMNPNESKRKSFENKEVEERNRVNSRRRQLYAQLSREEKDRRNYVRRVSYRQKRYLQCMEKGSSSNHDGCISDDTIIDGLQKECMVEETLEQWLVIKCWTIIMQSDSMRLR
ncbi:hypothetical protein Scep_027119 [Stephania cephalantha]|uniref:Uncharacterized protein n=1 Tax=Stephania cephalantha TaxID=152367 RepID=A0AAP0ELE9_9MAGN